mgnify:CR=1 FL=1
MNEFSATVADDIRRSMRLDCKDLSISDVLPERPNARARQINGIDCGLFGMWHCEGEVRRWAGEGWSLPFPTTS